MMAGRVLPLALVFAAAGLCLMIGLEIAGWWRGGETFPAAAARAADRMPPVRATAADASNQRDTWLNEILARPLFSPERRPVEVGVRGLPRLTGIIVSGAQKLAIFAGPANGQSVIAQAGGRIGAYEVRSVADQGVTLTGPTGTTTIRPTFDRSRPATPEPRPVTPLPVRQQPRVNATAGSPATSPH
jgi:hypothetical protein